MTIRSREVFLPFFDRTFFLFAQSSPASLRQEEPSLSRRLMGTVLEFARGSAHPSSSMQAWPPFSSHDRVPFTPIRRSHGRAHKLSAALPYLSNSHPFRPTLPPPFLRSNFSVNRSSRAAKNSRNPLSRAAAASSCELLEETVLLAQLEVVGGPFASFSGMRRHLLPKIVFLGQRLIPWKRTGSFRTKTSPGQSVSPTRARTQGLPAAPCPAPHVAKV